MTKLTLEEILELADSWRHYEECYARSPNPGDREDAKEKFEELGAQAPRMIELLRELATLKRAVLILKDDYKPWQGDLDAEGYRYDMTFDKWWKGGATDNKRSRAIWSSLHNKPIIYEKDLVGEK